MYCSCLMFTCVILLSMNHRKTFYKSSQDILFCHCTELLIALKMMLPISGQSGGSVVENCLLLHAQGLKRDLQKRKKNNCNCPGGRGYGNSSNLTMHKTNSNFHSTTIHALQATHHFQKRCIESNKFEPTCEWRPRRGYGNGIIRFLSLLLEYLPGGRYLQSFICGDSASSSDPLTFAVPFLTVKVPLSHI